MAKLTNSEALISSHEPETSKRSLLLPNYTAAVKAKPTVAHPQLRHLISCPIRRGVVYGVVGTEVLEFDLLNPQNKPRCIIQLEFSGEGPASFSAIPVPSLPNTILFAAGGLKSQIHLSLHSLTTPDPSAVSRPIWKYDKRFPGGTGDIVNSMIFIPSVLTDPDPLHAASRAEFRLITCINDRHVDVYDVSVGRDVKVADRLKPCGRIPSTTNINHATISPDGSTLVLVGDTSNVYLYAVHPGHALTFTEITTYTLPPPPVSFFLKNPSLPSFFGSRACFASAWSPCGLKFAVASQEGQLCVWDVRSSKPVFTYWSDVRPMPKTTNTHGSGDRDNWVWVGVGIGPEGNGPASGIRQVRFTAGNNGQRELLLWTEHTLNLHVIDARTFDMTTHMVFPFPSLRDVQSLSAPSSQPETREQASAQLSRASEIEILRTQRTPSPSRSQSDWSMNDESTELEGRISRRGSSPSPMHVDNDGAPPSGPQHMESRSQPIPIPQSRRNRNEHAAESTPPSATIFAPPSLPLSLRNTIPQAGASNSQQGRAEQVTPSSVSRPHSLEDQSRSPPPLNISQNRFITRLRVSGADRERLLAALGGSLADSTSRERSPPAVGGSPDPSNDWRDELLAAALIDLSETPNEGTTTGTRLPARIGSPQVETWRPIAERTITLPLSSLSPPSGSSSESGSNTVDPHRITAADTSHRFPAMQAALQTLIQRSLALTIRPPTRTNANRTRGGETPGSSDSQGRANINEARPRLDTQDFDAERAAMDILRAEIRRAGFDLPPDLVNDASNDSNSAEEEEGGPEIAGMCLDPTDGWVYVASTAGIVEWRVREREEGGGGSSGGWC